MKTIEGVEFWAFVSNPCELKGNLTDGIKLCDGKSVKRWLAEKFRSGFNFGIDNLKHGFYKIGGWCFDLRPFMKKYIYTYYDSIYTSYAPSIKGVRTAFNLRRVEKVAIAPKGF